MQKLTIRGFMTPAPLTIGVDASLAAAAELMRAHGIRHLPVLAHGALVGIVSERDLELVAGLAGIDPQRTHVRSAMTAEPYTLAPDTSLEWVANEMAQHHYDSVVVVERERVVGIFTTVDALRALQALLARARRRSRPVRAQHPPRA